MKVVADLKLQHILLGLNGCASMHSCPYCEGFKVKPNGEKTGGPGKWTTGILRTLKRCQDWYELWQQLENGDVKKLMRYMGNRYPPIPIFEDDKENELILSLYPPPMLHILLGMCGPWELYRNGKPESSVICQYVCQSVLFVQPIRSLI